METLTIKIPDGKAKDVSNYIEHIGGKVIKKAVKETEEEDEVTHESYFGENIRRVIKAFSK
ncbi:hypothetical protein [Mucilaginibacter celer]|uniref:Uncharacterized protein n=1 Tax=Mucilaginibacter celer TaxID=2305508 RepID=A0A494W1L4_9SPHI|nr:hypothetical protein [Mucilaginibacter celer]AYL97428.1 hypothetical protein HYN43_019900 [Mucilaginibacter celer]